MSKKISFVQGFQMRVVHGVGMALVLASTIFAQGGFNGPGRYVITNIKSGKVMDLDRNDQTTVIQFSDRGTDNQTWVVERADAGYFYLRNGMNGNALAATGNNNSAPVRGFPFNGGPAQQWRFEVGKDGNVLIVNSNGKALDVPDGSGRDGVRLQTYDVDGDSNQRFALRRAGGNNFRPLDRRDQDRREGDRRDGYDRDRGDPYNAPVPGRDRPDAYRNDRAHANSYFDDRENMWKLNGNGVCFYSDRNYRGEAFCRVIGDDIANVGPNFNDSFSSVKFFGRVQWLEAFENENFGGDRIRIQSDQPDLSRIRGRGGASFDDRITSFRVH